MAGHLVGEPAASTADDGLDAPQDDGRLGGVVQRPPLPARKGSLERADQPGLGRARVALRITSERGSVTRGDLSKACGISGETARQELAALTRLGYLRRMGTTRTARYVLP